MPAEAWRTTTGAMRIFRRGNDPRRTTWMVEVDYGNGFVPYSGSLDEQSADVFVRDLRRVGHKARVARETDLGSLHAADEAVDRRVLLWKMGAQKDSSLGG